MHSDLSAPSTAETDSLPSIQSRIEIVPTGSDADRATEVPEHPTLAVPGGSSEVLGLDPLRLARAKRSFNVRRIALGRATRLVTGAVAPRAGDVVLARVTRVGHHGKLQTPEGRRAELYVGDEVIVAFGDRYAPNQWEARVPGVLGPCHLAASGGLMAQVRDPHPRMRHPTVLDPVGILLDARGERVTLAHDALRATPTLGERPPTIAVVGASMDSGKTTSAASLVRGLSRAGLRVGAAKITGTGACGDLMKFIDSGAVEAIDFVDAGLATTYLQPLSEVERVARTLVGHLAQLGCEAIVVEIADGVLQKETAELLSSPVLTDLVDGYVFAAGEAMGGIAGVERLVQLGLDVRALSGILSASTLAREEAQRAVSVPVLGIEALELPATALGLFGLAGGEALSA